MKKRSNKLLIVAFILFVEILFQAPLYGQAQSKPFKGHFYDAKENIHLQLDLYEASLQVPEMDFIGNVHAYMHGNIYGIWLLTKFNVKGNVATLRFSHDSGADSQTVELTLVNDTTIKFTALDGNAIRKVHKRKLVKIPNELKFIKKE